MNTPNKIVRYPNRSHSDCIGSAMPATYNTVATPKYRNADFKSYSIGNFFCPTKYDKSIINKLPKNDAHALSLVFDFGGNAANTEISVGKIYLEKVKK